MLTQLQQHGATVRFKGCELYGHQPIWIRMSTQIEYKGIGVNARFCLSSYDGDIRRRLIETDPNNRKILLSSEKRNSNWVEDRPEIPLLEYLQLQAI